MKDVKMARAGALTDEAKGILPGFVNAASEQQVSDPASQLGYSGCSLRVVRLGPRVCVEKHATGPNAARLQRQIDRQEEARRAARLPFVRIPELYSRSWNPDGSYSALMEYLSFSNCISFFATASRPQIDRTVAMLMAYVDANLATSPLQEVAISRFTDKLDGIEAALSGSGRLASYGRSLQAVRMRLRAPLVLPLGRAHGDLTLSNVLIAADANQIGLLDFLDGYLDSPLVDIAKLRQDTCFHWSLCLSEGPVDRPRLEPILAYMDRVMLSHYGRHDWIRHLDLIQAINLLRIVPYALEPGSAARSHRVHAFLTHALAVLGF
jgi:hypothetical protein